MTSSPTVFTLSTSLMGISTINPSFLIRNHSRNKSQARRLSNASSTTSSTNSNGKIDEHQEARIPLPLNSLIPFQKLVAKFRQQLISRQASRTYYLGVILSSRNDHLDEESGQVAKEIGSVNDEAVLEYFTSFFPEITLVERCSNGGWIETSRVKRNGQFVIINGKTKSRGLISIISSIPITCSTLSDSTQPIDTQSKATTAAPTGLSSEQVNFVILAMLAKSILQDLNQHIFGTALNQSKSKHATEDELDGGWLLDLLRNQSQMVWKPQAEEALLEMRTRANGRGRTVETTTIVSGSSLDHDLTGSNLLLRHHFKRSKSDTVVEQQNQARSRSTTPATPLPKPFTFPKLAPSSSVTLTISHLTMTAPSTPTIIENGLVLDGPLSGVEVSLENLEIREEEIIVTTGGLS